jgi:hypothetical protein
MVYRLFIIGRKCMRVKQVGKTDIAVLCWLNESPAEEFKAQVVLEVLTGARSESLAYHHYQLKVLPHSVVDNSDCSPIGLTARETLLILAFQGALSASHFKEQG